MLGKEPALILGAVQAILALALSFGLKLDPSQIGAIMATAAALVALFVRHKVTPVGAAGPQVQSQTSNQLPG